MLPDEREEQRRIVVAAVVGRTPTRRRSRRRRSADVVAEPFADARAEHGVQSRRAPDTAFAVLAERRGAELKPARGADEAAGEGGSRRRRGHARAEGGGEEEEEEDGMKCPVPRPILNILMNRRGEPGTSDPAEPAAQTLLITSSEERERQWVATQISVFRDSYGNVPGYDLAEAYLESVLSLATRGRESERVTEVLHGGTYAEPYGRVLSAIRSVGAVLEEAAEGGGGGREVGGIVSPSSPTTRRQIAKKLIDQDFCLSMLDKIALANEMKNIAAGDADTDDDDAANPLAVPYDAASRLAYDADPDSRSVPFGEFRGKYEAEAVAMVTAKRKLRDEGERSSNDVMAAKTKESEEASKGDAPRAKGKRRWFAFWSRGSRKSHDPEDSASASGGIIVDDAPSSVNGDDDEPSPPSTPAITIDPDDLGGVLLSAEEPSMTRQLNVLSNICQRTLIFGGDQELLLLAETLDADKPAFIQRWYNKNDAAGDGGDVRAETRPGVQYLNSLIRLLQDCYTKGAILDVTPTLPLTAGYQNAYGRLTASLIELGSGYIRPSSSSSLSMFTAATEKYLTSVAPPKTPREELGRLAKWESALRKNSENPYPDE